MTVLHSYFLYDLLCKLIDWLLYEGSTGILWVNHSFYECLIQTFPLNHYMRVLVLMILTPFDLFLNKDEKFIDINLLWFTVQVACSCHRLNPIFFNALQFSVTLQFDIWYRPLLLNFTLFSVSLVISMIFYALDFALLCFLSQFFITELSPQHNI